ncbi:MAG: outer membrane beta-barrel protein [Muribaculaceae bacterium]|nr:outer membrane beta-barrel protein [Muribaculaceae bacterium]
MKKTIARVLAVIAIATAAISAQAAPIKVGPVVGVNINSLNLNDVSDNFSADNRCGFAAGVMAKFTVPIINIGVDLSALYEYRTTKMDDEGNSSNLHYNYLAVPLHLRYDIPMPLVSKVFYPTIFTGPNFAFRLGKSVVNDFKANKYNIGWDFGLGITLVQHLQLSAAYTLGINKAVSHFSPVEGADIKGRTNGWTITAAYLF